MTVSRFQRQREQEPPRRRHVISAKLLGRDKYRAWCARIEAGKCDPRFVVGLDAIMWDASRGVKS